MQTLSSLIVGYVALTFASSFAKELKLIQVLFRHGDRAPSHGERKLFRSDPYPNLTWYPEGWGGLTNGGKSNAYELGLFFKERYGQWLGNVYLGKDVVFRSSVAERSIMTTQVLAAALFPPSEIQRWNSKLDWQPIVVHSDYFTSKNLYWVGIHCHKHKSMRRELERTDEFLLNRTEKLTEVFDLMSRNVGRKIGHQSGAHVYHYLYALHLSKNMELPEWTEGIFPEGELERIASYDYIIQSYNKSMIQLTGGLWLREWLGNVDSYLNGSRVENRKGFFYGGHEANIGQILVALGVFEQHVPSYCSAVIFELSEIEEELYVKILYRNKGVLQTLLIPGCGNFDCPLATFRRLFADVITVDDVAAACEQN